MTNPYIPTVPRRGNLPPLDGAEPGTPYRGLPRNPNPNPGPAPPGWTPQTPYQPPAGAPTMGINPPVASTPLTPAPATTVPPVASVVPPTAVTPATATPPPTATPATNVGIPGGNVPPATPLTPGTPTPVPPGLGLDFMRNVTPNELVNNQLDALLNANSPYMRNARQRGVEYAASRGNINSSIAGGASQRAALEAALPIANADAQVYREANAANFDSLSQLRQMRVAGDIENWLADNTFNREFNGQLALMPIQSSLDMMAYIAQRAMEDPAVYTPDVMSGFQNFFQQNMFDILSNYFGNSGGG